MHFEKSTLHLEITSACNHRCFFCYNQHQVFDSERNQKIMSQDIFKKIIDKIEVLNLTNVVLTGGEPFLHPDIKEFIEYSTKKSFRLSINTNGTLLTPDICKYLSRKKISLLVSFHGINGLFNEIVGANTFNKVFNNLKHARFDFDLPITLQFVPLKKNFRTLPKVAKIAKELNCFLQIGRFTDPCGISEIFTEYGLSIEEYHELFNIIIEIKRNNKIQIGLGNGIPYCILNPESITNNILNLFNSSGCSLGKSIWAIDTGGNIRGCPQLVENLGNILNNEASELEHLLEKRYSYSEIIPEICRDCSIKLICSGGCRASALVRAGSIQSLDPLVQRDDNLRNNSIKLIEQKIRKIANVNDKELEKPLRLDNLIAHNKEISYRKRDNKIILRGFNSKGFVFKNLNETASDIFEMFLKPETINNALIALSKLYSIDEELIKIEVLKCIEDLVKINVLQILE